MALNRLSQNLQVVGLRIGSSSQVATAIGKLARVLVFRVRAGASPRLLACLT